MYVLIFTPVCDGFLDSTSVVQASILFFFFYGTFITILNWIIFFLKKLLSDDFHLVSWDVAYFHSYLQVVYGS